jgi:hypothetical protein
MMRQQQVGAMLAATSAAEPLGVLEAKGALPVLLLAKVGYVRCSPCATQAITKLAWETAPQSASAIP